MPASKMRVAEPEIVSPGQVDGRLTADGSLIFLKAPGTQHVDVFRFGQFGVALLPLAMMIATTFLIVALLGVFVIWIPVVVVFATGAFISSILRGHIGRLR